MDDIEMYSFNETKRAPQNYFGIAEIRAAEKDVFRLAPEWLPLIQNP